MILKDKVVVVTGGSQGIGKAIALTLAKQGAKIVVNYRTTESGAQSVVDEAKAYGSEAVMCKADVGKPEDLEKIIDLCITRFGKVDILINNAGIAPYAPFLETSLETWQRTIDVNLSSVFYLSQLAARDMVRKSIKGSIVNISSLGGEKAMRGLASYNASKGGLNLLTKTMALELGPYGICVNAVAPGAIAVDRNKAQLENSVDQKAWENIIPLGRWGNPEEIAKMVLFLVSEESTYLTGQVISIDGGQTAQVPQPLYDFGKWET